jgi:hypothetical protein
MPEKELVYEEELEHNGLVDFSAFYSFCHNSLKESGYSVVEEEYSEKVTGNSRDIGFKWKAGKKVGDYYKIEHAIKFDVGGLVDVEVEIDGKKKKMNKGKVKFKIKTTFIKDISGLWEGEGWFKKVARGIYDKYIIGDRTDTAESNGKDDAKKFKEEAKKFLEHSGIR